MAQTPVGMMEMDMLLGDGDRSSILFTGINECAGLAEEGMMEHTGGMSCAVQWEWEEQKPGEISVKRMVKGSGRCRRFGEGGNLDEGSSDDLDLNREDR